jgi:Tol biopolymer transport system component
MRRQLLLVATIFVATSCGDSSGPRGGRPGITLVSGYNLTDTIGARPVKALVVEVRDEQGAIVPQGTIVRFAPVATSYYQPAMMVEELTSTFFTNFAAGATDAAGHASVLVQMGSVAGPAGIAVSVPTLGVEDTARYTVLPGQPSAILLTPADTAMYAGVSYTIHGGVVDRWNNVRTDPVVYTATPGVSVSSSGVVTGSAIGRYAVTGTAGSVSETVHLSVIPQGTVAALTNRTDGLHIVTINLDGSGIHDVVGGIADGGIGPHPKWIPGTSTIVYTDYVGGLQQLRTVDASGKVSPFFANPPATMTHQAEPSPSANGTILYFSAYDSRCAGGSAYCVFRSGIDGTNPELLGDVIAPGDENPHPSASPDGSKVAFVTSGRQIRVFDYTTRTVSAWSVPGNYPAWSPDGTQIAYSQQSGGPLHLINADGTNQRLISAGRSYSEWPLAWSPDSKWLIAQDLNYGITDIIEIATGTVLPTTNPAGYFSLSWK